MIVESIRDKKDLDTLQATHDALDLKSDISFLTR